MATVNKDFRVKNGLVVEGTTAQVDGKNVILEGDSVDLLVEGTTNLYFTEDRVTDTLVDTTYVQWVNAQVAKDGGVLTITAEGGLEDGTTDDLDEGTTNLYFTDQRAIDAVTGGITLDDIDEGTTNLYFTDQRVQDVLVNSVQENVVIVSTDGILYISAENGVADSTTDDLDEGTVNLYYTNSRVEDVIAASDTDDLSEGSTNLYYTDSRARSAISGSTGITYSSTDGVIFVDTETIATVEYVNATAEGLHVHTSVSAATTANIADLSSPPATIDGVTLTEGMRVLVKDQETLSQNGIYVVDSGALVRSEDYDTAGDILPGDFVFVSGGTTQEATGWVQTETVGTLGTDDIVWTQFIGAGVYTAGEGLELSGNVFSLDATTDLVDEGTTNLYYKTQRVYHDLANSVQENISITTTDGMLYITAENGVDDSTTDDLDEGTINLYFTDQRVEDVIGNLTTDDLDEGTTNLYFTDQRAVDAIEAVVPNFTEIEINSVSKQVAATTNVADAETPIVVYSFDKTEYRSAKFIIKASSGSHTQISEILITLDSSDNVAVTEYAIVSTNGNLVEVTAAEATGDVEIIVEAENANTQVTVFGTLIV
jgi:hypothetical protein